MTGNLSEGQMDITIVTTIIIKKFFKIDKITVLKGAFRTWCPGSFRGLRVV